MLSPLIIDESTHDACTQACADLSRAAQARGVFLIDKNGLLITQSGDAEHVDGTALASLAAGNMAATNGIASLIGEAEFGSLFHQGAKESIHISVMGERMILVVLFDDRSSLGLVRLRVQQARLEFENIVSLIAQSGSGGGSGGIESEITSEDIDNLLRDS